MQKDGWAYRLCATGVVVAWLLIVPAILLGAVQDGISQFFYANGGTPPATIVGWPFQSLLIVAATAGLAVFFLPELVALWNRRSASIPIIMPAAPGAESAAEPDQEINLQQAFHLVCERLGITQRGGSTEDVDARLNVFRDLRQKARDGVVVIRGRAQPFGTLMGAHKPREAIPPEHWRDMGFDATRYIFGEGVEFLSETATEPDHKGLKGNPGSYFDLTVSKAAIENAWPISAPSVSRMISAKAFLAEAEKHGWNFGKTSLDANKLQVGLREAAALGRIQIFGRRNLSVASLTRNEPRLPISSTFWTSGWLQIIALIPPMSGENFDTNAYVPAEKPAYVDIHFGVEVLDWLKKEAAQYRDVQF
jgi:hypothetical protein